MIINQDNIQGMFNGFKTSFNSGFDAPEVYKNELAMVVPSTSAKETYAWLGQMPGMREWIGDRFIRNLSAHSQVIENKLFEDTIEVKRTHIEDDSYGLLAPLFTEMGRVAAIHPDELLFSLLSKGFTELCYDGQPFFDADHPVAGLDDNPKSASNISAGSGPAWYVMDLSKALKPLIFQERVKPELQQVIDSNDERVFMKDSYLYGLRARSNAGFGMWQLAHGSKGALTGDAYETTRKNMMSLTGDSGRPLGIRPDTIVVSPENEAAARTLFKATDNGNNIWAGSLRILVSPWLS